MLDTNEKRVELYNQRVMNYTANLLWIFTSSTFSINVVLMYVYFHINKISYKRTFTKSNKEKKGFKINL